MAKTKDSGTHHCGCTEGWYTTKSQAAGGKKPICQQEDEERSEEADCRKAKIKGATNMKVRAGGTVGDPELQCPARLREG